MTKLPTNFLCGEGGKSCFTVSSHGGILEPPVYTGWLGMELLDDRTLLPSMLKAIALTPSLEEGNLSPEERGEVGDIREGEVRERESYSCVWWYTSVIPAFEG